MKGSGGSWDWAWIPIYINSSFMFNQIMSLHVVTLRMVCDCIQNKWSILLPSWSLKASVCVCACVYVCERESTNHMQAKWLGPWYEPGTVEAQRTQWFTFSKAGKEKFCRKRRWYVRWSWVTESVSTVLHSYQVFGQVEIYLLCIKHVEGSV